MPQINNSQLIELLSTYFIRREESKGGGFVDLTTNQTVGGVKTFTSIPVLPASDPVSDEQAVRKKYVDDKIPPVFLNPPSCRVYNSANISIPNNSTTALTFNSERWDTDAMHSAVTNTGRLTAPIDGIYSIYGCVSWAGNATGVRSVTVRLNGSTLLAVSTISNVGASDNPRNIVYTEYTLTAGDYVELTGYQNRGGALDIVATGNYSPEFGMTWLRPLP